MKKTTSTDKSTPYRTFSLNMVKAPSKTDSPKSKTLKGNDDLRFKRSGK